jgi:YHS domain-containing protein
MKYLSIVAAGLLLASCGNNQNTENKDHNTGNAEQEIAITKDMDPICKMTRDTSFVDYYVHNADTTWFCSPHCKDVFAANPEKYKTTAKSE